MIRLDIRNELKVGKNIYELPLRVCYYARVSTDHEEQFSSIINQVDYFVNYVGGIANWKLVNGYIDEGISGKEVFKRENFIRMINDGRNGKFDLILTKSVSRFARNTIDSIYYTNLLLDMGIGVMFINDNINTFYGDSEFRLTLMASIAQDEIRKLSESVKFGLRQSIKRGVVLGNDNILGYSKKRGILVVNEEESLIVREIFDLYLNGIHNYSEVARMVNNKYDKKLNGSSIKRILTNYKYKGYYCGRKSEVIDYKRSKRKLIDENEWVIYKDYSVVPAIVEEDVWDFVNEIIRTKKDIYKDVYRGKVFCNIHGRMVSKNKKYNNKYYSYYICRGCCSVSGKLLDRITGESVIKKVIVSKGAEFILRVSFEKKTH